MTEKVSKTCNSCGRILPVEEFRRHKGHGDGYDSRCKECMRREAREKTLLKAPLAAKVNPKVYGELVPKYRAMVKPYLDLRSYQQAGSGPRETGLVEAAADAFVAFFTEFTSEEGGFAPHARAWVTAALAHPRLLLNVPPGHAKTTYMAKWFVIWQIACDRDTQVILVSRTIDLGKQLSYYIANQFEANEDLIKAFGRFRPKNLSRPWRIALGELEVEGKDLTKRHGLSLQIRGAGQAILGMRADWVIADDITNRAVANSDVERMREWDYFLGEVITRLEPWGKAFCIGQRVHGNDIYGRLALEVDIDGSPNWHQERMPAIIDEESQEVLWPQVWPYERLRDRRRALGSALFTCMYQQAPEISGDFVEEWWLEGNGSAEHPGCYDRDRSVGQGWVQPNDLAWIPVTRALLVDPSPTRYAGLVVIDIIYQHRAKFFYGAVVDVLRLPPGHGLRGMVQGIEDLAKQYRPQVCIFEENSAKYLKDDPAWNRIKPLFKVLPHDTTKWNKHDTELGVWSLAADIEAGRIRFPWATPEDRERMRPLIEEILSYPNGSTDDCLMALWFGKANYRLMLPREFLPTAFNRTMSQVGKGAWNLDPEAGKWGLWRSDVRQPARPS